MGATTHWMQADEIDRLGEENQKLKDRITELQEHNELSDGCFIMIRETLMSLGCMHVNGGHEDTPPMFYNDWIRCVVAKQIADRDQRIANLETDNTRLAMSVGDEEWQKFHRQIMDTRDENQALKNELAACKLPTTV